MEHPVIRKAAADDVEQMVALLEILFSIEKDFVFDPDKHRKGLRLMLSNDDTNARCIYVAELNQTILGMCSIQAVVSTAEGGMAGLIEDMVVQKEWQGKGLGKMLLNEILTWAKAHSINRVQLLADRQNRPALGFYKKQGWQTTELICLRRFLGDETRPGKKENEIA